MSPCLKGGDMFHIMFGIHVVSFNFGTSVFVFTYVWCFSSLPTTHHPKVAVGKILSILGTLQRTNISRQRGQGNSIDSKVPFFCGDMLVSRRVSILMLGRSVNKILPSKKESWKLQGLGFSSSVEASWGKADLAMTWYWDVEPEF